MSLADWIVAYGAVAAFVSAVGLLGLLMLSMEYTHPDEEYERDVRFAARVAVLSPLWLPAAVWGLIRGASWLVRTAFPTQKEDR